MEEITTQLNLSETASQIFNVILMKGCVSASSVAIYLDMKVKSVESEISDLEKKKLVRKASGKVPRYIPLPPFRGFINYLGEYTKDIKETINRIQEIDSSKTDNFEKISQKTNEALEKQLDSLLKDSKKKNAKIEKKVKQTTESAIDTVDAAEEKSTNGIKSILDSTKASINTDITTLKDGFSKELDQHNLHLAELVEKIPENLDHQYAEILGEQRSSLNDAKTFMGKATEDSFVDIKGEITTFMGDFDVKVNQLKNNNKDFLQSNEAKFHTLLEDMNTHLTQTLNKSVTQTQSLITSLQKETTGTLEDFLALHAGSTEKFSLETHTLLGDLKLSIEKSLQDYQTLIVDQSQYQYEEAKHRLSDRYVELKDNLTKVIETSVQEMTVLLGDVGGKIITSVEQKFLPSLMDGKEKLITSVQEKLAHQTTVFTDFMNGFLNNYKQMGVAIESELHQEISDKISDLHGTTAEFLEDFTNDIDSAKNTVRDQFQVKEDENLAFLDEGMETLTTEYDTLSGALKTHITNTTTQCSTELSKSLETTDQTIESFIKTNSQEFKDKITAVQTQFTEKSENTRTEFTENTNGKISEVQEKITGMKSDLSSELTLHREAEEKILVEIVAAQETLGKIHIEAMKGHLDTFQDIFNANVDDQLTALGQFKDATTQEFLEKGNGYKEAIGITIINIKTDFDTLLGAKSTDLTTSLSEILDTHTASISENIQKLTDTFSTANIETVSIFKELEELVSNTIKKIKNTAKTSIDTGKQVLNDELGKVFETSLETMSSVKDLGEEPIKILESAWEAMTSIDVIKAEKTWHLIGEDAIYPYIKSMIRDVKSKLTLVLPSWDDVPFDALMEKKARMTIITSVPSESQEQVDKLKEKGAQIMDYSGQDFIAIDRDGEELLFAPVSAEEKPTTAIISEVEPMIRIVGSMISDYWRSKARKL
ncbi:MAG: hypothetical protein ACTSWW_11910 [Promethearchaeota archaeon]